jgi:hypothetical protein
MAGKLPTRYVGPSPSGGYYYANLATGDIIDSSNAPTPEQIANFEADKPQSGTIGVTQAVDRGDTQTLGGPATGATPVFTANQVNRDRSADDAVRAPTSGGVGAGTSPNASAARGNDNTPPASSNTSQQVINQTFANQRIVAQPNVLDQYASYTYAISWWVLTPDQYNSLTSGLAPAPGSGNWSLLMQSGGAPTAGRNQFFPLDYYLDDLEIETVLAGKGTGMSTNGMTIKFKVVEPNGLTLIQNLYSAVQTAALNTSAQTSQQAASGTATPGTVNTNQTSQPPNYGAAQYCLTIEFYGYDERGNLVAPARGQISTTGQLATTNPQSVIKKYYPFLIENITFRTVANQIEYHVIGHPVPYDTGTSQARGTIPFAFQLSGQTVAQLLQGSTLPVTAKTDEGRAATPAGPRPTQATNSQIDEFLINAGTQDARQGSVSAVSAGSP